MTLGGHELHVSRLRSHGEVPLYGVTVVEPAQERPPEAHHHRCLLFNSNSRGRLPHPPVSFST